MSLTAEQIIDRMRLKRQIFNWRFLAILLGTFLLFTLIVGNGVKKNRVSMVENDYIARIYLDGVIFDDHERLESLRVLDENKNIKGVIVHVNSPGGTIVGGENLYNSILRISSKKPVVIVMGDVAASAAYMASIAGNYIIAHKGTMTGSIGVIAQTFEATELADKIGIKFHNFKSSPLKGGPLPTEPLSEEMKESMYDLIHDAYSVFFNMVAERRKISPDKLVYLADGRVFSGNQSLKNGLIDAIGDEETALEWLQTTQKIDKNIKVYNFDLIKTPSKLDLLLDSMHKSSIFFEKLLNVNYSIFS